MKKLYFILLCFLAYSTFAQITTPIIKGGFGVDGEFKSNFFNGAARNGNDDWFKQDAGSGVQIIDTAGAASIISDYVTTPVTRQLPFFRTMSYPPFSIVNNHMLIDAVFIRDYHGDDSTVFASGSNKNGDSPGLWSCPVSQSIPDKNEILDMMVHVRREGPTASDSLWMFAGMSIENTSGSRYIDFEMYQTDIFYNRSTRKFTGYGPDAGHTIWQFNGAGQITVPGDVIFTAEFGSSLDLVEARIWINKAMMLITPQAFDWTGSFDGASNSATFGYAGIQPKTAGNFYTGLPCLNRTWGGPFQIVLGNNSVSSNYIANQYVEFSVNLTKLGLDPVTLLGSGSCALPFRRVLAKSRSSHSFTSELKDFVGPFDFFITPKVAALADIPIFCGVYNVSNLTVTNPVSTSVYEWSTTDGHIVGTDIGTSIYVDAPGTYIVNHRLQSTCPIYASDTIQILFDANCFLLANNIISLTGMQNNQFVSLNWRVSGNEDTRSLQVERSLDGIHFTASGKMQQAINKSGSVDYSGVDDINNLDNRLLYYRIKMISKNGKVTYSGITRISIVPYLHAGISGVTPNPAKDKLSIQITSVKDEAIHLSLHDLTGKLIRSISQDVKFGHSSVDLQNLGNFDAGVYVVKVYMNNNVFVRKIVLSK
ncbi:MAG: T9SS type A sorting domain-containing protein [Ferruginibacter sp.]